jgi:hypothetical protein
MMSERESRSKRLSNIYDLSMKSSKTNDIILDSKRKYSTVSEKKKEIRK